jgi:hypothetical protein
MVKFLDRIHYIICVDGSQPATKALEYAANLATKISLIRSACN